MTTDKKIKELSLKLIPLSLKCCTLNLIYDTCEIHSSNETDKIPSEIEQIKNDILFLIKDLQNQLKQPMDNRKSYVNKINETRNSLVKIAHTVYMYISFANQTGRLASRYHKLKQLERAENHSFNLNLLMHDCENYINKEDESFTNKFNMGRLIANFPIKLTKAKYSDYINKSCILMFENLPKEFTDKSIELLKDKFAPFKTNDYGKYYPDYSNKIMEMFNSNFAEMEENEINEILDSLDEILKEFDKITYKIRMYYNDLNYILNIALFCVDSEYLFDKDFVFRDLYYSACNIIENKNRESIIEDVIKLSSAMTEKVINEISPLAAEFYGTVDKIEPDSISEDTEICINTFIIIDNNYKRELTEEFGNYGEEKGIPADKEYILLKASELNEFIDTSLNNFDNYKKKYLKQIFLENIPCPMENNEYIDYLYMIMKDNEKTAAGLLAISDVFTFFEDNGFNTKGNHHHHHHHEHGHDCGCGHHH